MKGFDPAAVTKTLTGYGLKPLPNASREPLVTYISLRMPNRGGAEGGTPELYLTDPDGLAIQLQDVTYCGGAGFLGDVLPLSRVAERMDSMRSRSLALLLAGISATVLSGQVAAAARHPREVALAAAAGRPRLARRRRQADLGLRGGHARHAGHGAGPADDVQPQSRRADPRAQSVPADHGGGPALLRAVGADRGARVRSAVRMVGTRAGRAARRAGTGGDRRGEVQSRRRRPAGEGRHSHPPRPRALPRSQGESGAVGDARWSCSAARARWRSPPSWATTPWPR